MTRDADAFIGEARKASQQKPFSSTPQGNPRPYESLIIIGPSGYGKTSLVDEILTGYRRKGGNVWVVDPARSWTHHPDLCPERCAGAHGHLRRIPWTVRDGGDELDRQLERMETIGPGMLIFDDADLYYKHPTDARMEIIVANRHWQKDVVMIARRPQGIPKDIFQIADSIACFCMRQAYARHYLKDEFNDEGQLVRMIPTEKYKYLYVHRPTNTYAILSTKPRTSVTAADMR